MRAIMCEPPVALAAIHSRISDEWQPERSHSDARIENSTVSRTWPVQVIRSARSTPSRTAPSLAIAAWLRRVAASTRNSIRRKPQSMARPSIRSLTRRLKPVPRMAGHVIGVADLEHAALLVDADDSCSSRPARRRREDGEGRQLCSAMMQVEVRVEMVGIVGAWNRSARCRDPRRRRRLSAARCASRERLDARTPSPASGSAELHAVFIVEIPRHLRRRAAACRYGCLRRSSRRAGI